MPRLHVRAVAERLHVQAEQSEDHEQPLDLVALARAFEWLADAFDDDLTETEPVETFYGEAIRQGWDTSEQE